MFVNGTLTIIHQHCDVFEPVNMQNGNIFEDLGITFQFLLTLPKMFLWRLCLWNHPLIMDFIKIRIFQNISTFITFSVWMSSNNLNLVTYLMNAKSILLQTHSSWEAFLKISLSYNATKKMIRRCFIFLNHKDDKTQSSKSIKYR